MGLTKLMSLILNNLERQCSALLSVLCVYATKRLRLESRGFLCIGGMKGRGGAKKMLFGGARVP